MAVEIDIDEFDGIECLYFPYGIHEEMLSCRVATIEELDQITCQAFIEDEHGRFKPQMVYTDRVMVCNADAYMPE